MRKIYFATIFLLLNCLVYSQETVVKLWTKQLGTANEDYGRGVATDASGNIYVTGRTNGSLDGNTNAGYYDIFLVKYGSAGNKLWTKQLGTANDDYGRGVATDASGNIYVTGETYGSLDGNTNAGGIDIFLVKYDSAGNKIWTKQLGTTSDDVGLGVATDASGNIYVTGDTYGSLDGNTNAAGYNIFLVKYDSAGNKIWIRQLGTAYSDEGNGVATDASGNIYVTGATAGSLDGNTNAGGYDIFLVKYDSAGNKIWTKQLGTGIYDEGHGVATDASGNIYVTGSTLGSLDGNTNAGGYDIFLVKYDSAGNKIWTRQLGTANDDEGWGVATDASENIYVTGRTYGSLDGNTNAGSWDIFLVKYDSAGNKIWTKQLGTVYSNWGYGVATDASGNIYVTGDTYGNLDGNTNAGYEDIFLVKFGQPTATGTIAELASKIYPNPFNPNLGGNITIDKLPTSGQTTIKIYTVTGELVKEIIENDGDGKTTWNGLNTAGNMVGRGIYTVFIDNPPGKKKIKIAVEK